MFGSDQRLNEREGAIYADWQNETPAKLDRTSVSGWVLCKENEQLEGQSFLGRRELGGGHPETGKFDSKQLLSQDSCGLDSCRWERGIHEAFSKWGICRLFITYEAHEFLLMLWRCKMLFWGGYGKGAFLKSLSKRLISSEHSWCCLNSLYSLKAALRGKASGAVGLETACGKPPCLSLLLLLPPFLQCLTAQCDSWLMCLSCSSRAQKSLLVVHSPFVFFLSLFF